VSTSRAAQGSAPIPVLVAGARGRMGALACGWIAAADGLQLVAELRRGDDAVTTLAAHPGAVLLDVTELASSVPLVTAAVEHGVHPVIGTSGWSAEQLAALELRCAEHALGALWVPNFSIGAVLQMRFAEQAARWFDAAAIHETHHPAKRDAPSGTARATAERMRAASGGAAVPIESSRRAGVLAEQHVTLAADHERLELRHVVSDRSAYAAGALLALRRVRELSGLVRGLDALLGYAAL